MNPGHAPQGICNFLPMELPRHSAARWNAIVHYSVRNHQTFILLLRTSKESRPNRVLVVSLAYLV